MQQALAQLLLQPQPHQLLRLLPGAGLYDCLVGAHTPRQSLSVQQPDCLYGRLTVGGVRWWGLAAGWWLHWLDW